MSVVIQDNFGLAAAKDVDNRYGTLSGALMVPYADLTAAYAGVPSQYRYLGLTVGILDGSRVKEWWYRDDLNTLVPKTTILYDGTTGIVITPGTFSDCVGCSPNCNSFTAYDWTTNTNDFYGKNNIHSISWFQGNVGIGTVPDSNNPSCGNGTKLSVERAIDNWNTTFSAGRGATSSALTLYGALGTDSSNGEITSGIGGTLNFNPTVDTTLKTNHISVYAGITGRVSYSGSNPIGDPSIQTIGQLSGFSSRALFSDEGGVIAPDTNGPSLETYIGFQAESPQAYGGDKYTGTLTNAIGVKIEDQTTGMGSTESNRLAGAGLLVNSFGIVQGDINDGNAGKNDRNYFAGNTGIGALPDKNWTITNANNASKLSVFKSGVWQNSPIDAATESSIEYDSADSRFTSLSGTSEHVGLHGGLWLNFNGAQTVLPNQVWAGVMGYPGYIGQYDINDIEVSGVVGQMYCAKFYSTVGNINGEVIGLYAKGPIPYQIDGWGGTISHSIGVKISDQKKHMNNTPFTGYITNTYGIVQGDKSVTTDGIDDINIYNSKKNVFPNMVSAADDTAAAAAGVPLYGLYHTAGTVKIRLV